MTGNVGQLLLGVMIEIGSDIELSFSLRIHGVRSALNKVNEHLQQWLTTSNHIKEIENSFGIQIIINHSANIAIT